MAWDFYTSLKASLKDFLEDLASSENLVDSDGETINFYIDKKNDINWQINAVVISFESQTSERIFVGSNQRDERFLIIIDIFAKNEIDRLMLARWVTESINDGFQVYTYSTNVSTPEIPDTVALGWGSINFLTNTRVALGQNIDELDAHRHRISINVWIVD